MENEIKKAIIPVAGLGTRFLPMSRVLSKDLFPLVDKPVIQYIVEEAVNSGVKEIVFVLSPGQKTILEYFRKAPDLERLLVKRKKDALLKEYKEFEAMVEKVKFSSVVQKEALGDGHAILQAASKINNEPVVNSFGDDVVYSDKPALSQLIEVYKTCNAPVLALKKLPRDKVSAYGSVAVEKIANNLYKIKKIIEKPKPDEIMSDLVVVGKHVLTPEVFDYLKKAKPSAKGEIILAEVFGKMLEDGKALYGYELKGEWLECGDKEKWLKSFFFMTLHNSKFGPELKQYIKTIK